MTNLTHVDAAGAARMVDVSAKPATVREATAAGRITMSPGAAAAIRAGAVKKGDVLAVARVAGIMAAKRTADLIPLCHPLPISGVTLDLDVREDGISATATVRTTHTTGVEMEALTAVSVALLTIYDMAKALDRGMILGDIRLLAKSGGRSGDWTAAPETCAMSLLPVAEAQARLFALAKPLPVEQAPLVGAAGRWAAADLLALRDQPSADLSAMDGYAIRFAERPGPWTVIGESAAGGGLDRPLAAYEAARIFTGAPMPEGADSVLIQEEAARDGNRLLMSGDGPRAPGTHVRPRATDFASGEALIRAGQRIDARHAALAAIGGHATLRVRRHPRVVLLSTGDELVPPGAPTPGALLPASNGPMLAALLAAHPAIVTDSGVIRDDLAATVAAFRAAANEADIIVTTGGASVGDHDLVRPALLEAGARLDFWRIAMRPGKPLLAGRLGDAIVLGLPGNPVSAYITARLFLLPLIAHLGGAVDPLPKKRAVTLGAALPATGPRADYLRARLVDGRAVASATQDSGQLLVLAAADGLIVRPPDAPPAAAGDSAEMLDIP